MLFEKGLSSENDVINTGIIGASAKHLKDLKYFDDFDNDLKLMCDLKDGSGIFLKKYYNILVGIMKHYLQLN